MTNDKNYKQERDEAAEKYANEFYVIAPDSYHEKLCKGYKAGFNAALTSSIVKELVEALEFYAQKSVWGNGCAAINSYTYTCEYNVLRGGKKAIAALKKYREATKD